MSKFGLIAAVSGIAMLALDLVLRVFANVTSWLWLPGFLALAGGSALFLWSRWSAAAPVVPAPKSVPTHGTDTARLLDNFEQRFAELKARKPNATILADLYALGTQLEQRGRASQATAVYRHLARTDNTYRDVSARLGRLMDAERAKPRAAAPGLTSTPSASNAIASAAVRSAQRAGGALQAPRSNPAARGAGAGSAVGAGSAASSAAGLGSAAGAGSAASPAAGSASAAARARWANAGSSNAGAVDTGPAFAGSAGAGSAGAESAGAGSAGGGSALAGSPRAGLTRVGSANASAGLGAGSAANADDGEAAPGEAMPAWDDELEYLGRYHLEREIGRGAMGVVYLGRDTAINRSVAIKAIPLASEFSDAELTEARARFFREAETAGRLNHPNIVTIYDVGEEGGLAYIAMEYLKGRHLSDYATSNNLLEPRKVLDIIARTADALGFAHKQQVVHRDIKPANLMYDASTDVLKITDFGIARLSGAGSTRTGIVLGTPSFMSPEQLEGRTVTGHSDLFSLGVSLFQLLTGQLPFTADSMTGLMQQIAEAPHPPLRAYRPDLPACVESVIDRALAKTPEARFDSGAQMAAALDDCRARIPSGAP